MELQYVLESSIEIAPVLVLPVLSLASVCFWSTSNWRKILTPKEIGSGSYLLSSKMALDETSVARPGDWWDNTKLRSSWATINHLAHLCVCQGLNVIFPVGLILWNIKSGTPHDHFVKTFSLAVDMSVYAVLVKFLTTRWTVTAAKNLYTSCKLLLVT